MSPRPPARRLLVTVCPNERGTVLMRTVRGGRRQRLDARAVLRELEALVVKRALQETVEVRAGCAGGCHGRGPNVSVAIYPPVRPGERPDHIAVGWRSYVGVLEHLDALAAVIDENLTEPGGRPTHTSGDP